MFDAHQADAIVLLSRIDRLIEAAKAAGRMEMQLAGDDVAAALCAAMEADEWNLDAEAAEHCNAVVGKWIAASQPEAHDDG